MIEKRRYLIGDLSSSSSEMLTEKMQRQIKIICFICFTIWLTLTLTIVPRSSEVYITQSISEEKSEGGFLNFKYLWVTDEKGKDRGLPQGRKQKTSPDNSQNSDDDFEDRTIKKSKLRTPKNMQYHYNLENKNASLGDLARQISHFLTKPTTFCNHLVRVGGRSCLGNYDGSKLVCMDEDVELNPADCLVYSFGVGNDFTFDNHIQDYGCEVHSFDHDNDHENYDYRQGPRAYFHKMRIGIKNGFFKSCELTQFGMRCEDALRYQKMADILRYLGHESKSLDYFKMDIEGAEWLVLEDVIHNSTVLHNVKQIALEIHMDLAQHINDVDEKRELLEVYLDVLLSLRRLGFQVAAYEENELLPKYTQIEYHSLSVYAEVLMLKRPTKSKHSQADI